MVLPDTHRDQRVFIIELPDDEHNDKQNAKDEQDKNIRRSPALRSTFTKTTQNVSIQKERQMTVRKYLRAHVNNPMPAIVNPVPTRSNLFNASRSNFILSDVSAGMVTAAMMVKMMYMIAKSQKLARQLKICVAIPAKIIPKTKPKGFPALKHAMAAFLRCEGFA